MKMIKKILASGAAAAALLTMGTTANASSFLPIKSADWSVDYSFGAPSSVSTQICDCRLTYTRGGFQSTTEDFYGGGDGYVSVSVRGTERWKITGRGKVPSTGCYLSDADADGDYVNFRFTAVGTRVVASGTVHHR